MPDLNRRDIVKYLGALLPGAALLAEPAFASAAPAPDAGAMTVDEAHVQELVASVKPAVVLLEVETEYGIQWGSGFFVSSDGTLVTNRHVVNGAQKVTCLLKNKEKVSAKVLKIDAQYDIAIVKAEVAKPVPTVTLGDSGAVHEGLLVAVTGYPAPNIVVYLGMALDSSTSRGCLNGLRYGGDVNTFLGDRVLQIDAPVTGGNSGGPVYRLDTGEVVGILTATAAGAGNLTFAMPINAAKVLMSGLGIHPASNVAKASSAEAVVEAGDLRTLNTLGPTKELPALFGFSAPFTPRFDEEQTAEAIRDWKYSTGQRPPRVAPMVLNGSELFFGATDGKFYSLKTTELGDAPVLLDVADEGQIFVHEPVVTDQIICAVAGSLDLTSEYRAKKDAMSVIGGIFGNGGGSKQYIIAKGRGQIFGMNRRNGSIEWKEVANFSGTPIIYDGKVYYGGVGERGCLEALQGTRISMQKNRASDVNGNFDYIQKDGDKPFWSHVGYAGPLGLFAVVVPMEGKNRPNGGLSLMGRDKAYLRSFDIQTGKKLWDAPLGDVHDHEEPMSTAMFVDEKKGIVYALALQTAAAFDAKTGKSLWTMDQSKQEGGGKKKKGAPSVRFTPGMVIEEGVIYIGSTDRKLHAINGTDGTEMWAYNTRGSVGYPTYHEGQIIFGSTDKYIHVVDARTGALNWRVRISSPVRSRVVVHSGMVYAPTEDGTIHTLRIPLS